MKTYWDMSSDSEKLHRRAYAGELQKCENSLKRNTTDVLSMTSDGYTALHRAAQSRSGEASANLCELLVRHGIPINAVALDCSTPLHCAVLDGDTYTFMRLIRLGADPTIKDINGKTPIDNYNEDDNIKEKFEVAHDAVMILEAEKRICELRRQVAALKAGPDGQSIILALVNAFNK